MRLNSTIALISTNMSVKPAYFQYLWNISWLDKFLTAWLLTYTGDIHIRWNFIFFPPVPLRVYQDNREISFRHVQEPDDVLSLLCPCFVEPLTQLVHLTASNYLKNTRLIWLLAKIKSLGWPHSYYNPTTWIYTRQYYIKPSKITRNQNALLRLVHNIKVSVLTV